MALLFDRRPGGSFRLPVRVLTVSEPLDAAEVPEVGETENLSQGGVLLRQGKPVTPGVALRVTLRLRRRPALTLEGRVVWTRPHPDLPGWALGIRFKDDLPDEMVIEIADEEHPPWGPPLREETEQETGGEC